MILAPMVDQSEFVCFSLFWSVGNEADVLGVGMASAHSFVHASSVLERYPSLYAYVTCTSVL